MSENLKYCVIPAAKTDIVIFKQYCIILQETTILIWGCGPVALAEENKKKNFLHNISLGHHNCRPLFWLAPRGLRVGRLRIASKNEKNLLSLAGFSFPYP